MKRTIVTIIIVIAVLGLIGYILQKNKEENKAKTDIVAAGSSGDVVVKVQSVTKSALNINFSTNGTFEGNQDLTLSAENSGRINHISVKEGDRVSKGQVVARIDDEILGLETSNAKASLANAKRDLERYQSSYATGGVTQQQLDQQKLLVENAESRLRTSARKDRDANIKAPISGIVNKRFIENGSYVSPGTQLFEIVDLSTLKLKVTANEMQVVNLQKGDEVSIQTNVFPGEAFSGKISFIAAKADANLTFPVEIIVNNNRPHQLKAGMYGTAVFDMPNQQETILVDRAAFVGSVSSNKVYVFENGVARERNVVAGRVIGDKVEVVKGLAEGDNVIVSGQINLADGVKVQVIK